MPRLFTRDLTVEQKGSVKTSITVPTYTTVTTNGTLSLTSASSSVHFLTGVGAGYSVVMPDATTLELGTNYEIYNRTGSLVTVKYFDGTTLGVLSPESVSSLVVQDNSTSKGVFSPFTVEIAQAAGIANYSATSTTPFSTTSTTYTPIAGFIVTPAAGTYAIFFNGSCQATTNNSIIGIALYRAGVLLADTERSTQSVASNFTFQTSTLGIAQFNGAQTLEVYVKTTAGTVTVNARTGVALRLGA